MNTFFVNITDGITADGITTSQKDNNSSLNSINYQNINEAFERIVYHQINDFMIDKLSKQLTGFRKNHSTNTV